jgi:predicted nuclease of predicted toxin-antitoxin system
VKFLVDNQLPPALARLLISRGSDCVHVLEAGLDGATDKEIWDFAAAQGFVLISKDEDFFHRSSRPNASVSLVWVRLGNCRKQALLAAFDKALPQLIAALQAGDHVVELR